LARNLFRASWLSRYREQETYIIEVSGRTLQTNSKKIWTLRKKEPIHKLPPKHGLPQVKSPATSILKNSFKKVKQKPKSSLLANKRERSQKNTLCPEESSSV
jgi:hypothetical protein